MGILMEDNLRYQYLLLQLVYHLPLTSQMCVVFLELKAYCMPDNVGQKQSLGQNLWDRTRPESIYVFCDISCQAEHT